MTLWLIFALMTAAAIFAVLWPLSRPSAARSTSGIAIYRDQLNEIVRDRAIGLIGEDEARAAHIEVSRRLIAAGDAEARTVPFDENSAQWRRRAVAVVALLVMPLAAAAIYLVHGSPKLPGAPLAARIQGGQDNSIRAQIAQIESHLERNPNDARGWDVLAPVYLRLGRFDDAVQARRNALNYGGETAQRQADLGEAVTAAANGVVTADAVQSFERALVLEPTEPKSRFYSGLAAQQDGNRDKAADIWRALLADSPADAPWVPAVRQALAGLSQAPTAAGPSADDISAASNLTEAERSELVRGMVTRLAERLKQDGSDVEGWMRLIHAYMVLGDRAKADAAFVEARRTLASDPDKSRRIDEFAKSIGLKG